MYLGMNKQGEPVSLPSEDLLTHGVVLGRTGSGKTGLQIMLIEEAVAAGASAIVFDPKGDLTNLALPLTTKEGFARWAEPGVAPEDAIRRHEKGLSGFGLGLADVADWRNKTRTMIFAPGRTYGGGRLLNIFPEFNPPRQVSRDTASRAVATVLQALKEGLDPYDPALVFMTEAVLRAWEADLALPIDMWPGLLTSPPSYLQAFGGMGVDTFFSKRKRNALARKLIGFHHQADRWLKGQTLNLHELVAGKPTIAVFSLRHLTAEERLFFTSIVMQRVVDFMFETSSSKNLKLLVVLDEARGYLPPHPSSPPTKHPICTILAQGRAQGIGMLVGTQNPMDLDYKALSNVGTWFVGRLRGRDCARDLASELRDRNVEVEDLADLPQRRFLLLDKRGGHQLLNVRWCFNYLRGPLSSQELLRFGPRRRSVTPRPGKEPKRGIMDRLFRRRENRR
jgi:hypothetical protein